MDTENFKIFINELADASGEYIAKSFGENIDVDFKADNSPVTKIDKNTELLLREKISKKYPTHGIIGEEFGNSNENAEFVWVLDPIDGTKSFITKVPLFGTLIGLMHCGKPVLGAINQPILKERMVGDCKTCTFNGKRVEASRRSSLEGITLLSSDCRSCADLFGAGAWGRLERKAAISRTWGDCYGYMLLCRGLAHVMCDPTLEVWDFTALLPALQGAGAVYSDCRGGGSIGRECGLIACCSKEIYAGAMEILSQK